MSLAAPRSTTDSYKVFYKILDWTERVGTHSSPSTVFLLFRTLISCHCCYAVDFTAGIVDWCVLRVVERVCSQLYVAIGSALLRRVYDD